jgi:hypothetical protein
MVEIENKIVELVEADSTVTGLLGGDEEDSRVYKFDPASRHQYSNIQPAILLYRLFHQSRQGANWSYPSQKGHVILYFRAVSIDDLVASQIADALFELFDKSSLQTDNWSVKWIQENVRNSGESEGTSATPLFVENISFNLTHVFKRTVV